jgi:hypothetical protein
MGDRVSTNSKFKVQKVREAIAFLTKDQSDDQAIA